MDPQNISLKFKTPFEEVYLDVTGTIKKGRHSFFELRIHQALGLLSRKKQKARHPFQGRPMISTFFLRQLWNVFPPKAVLLKSVDFSQLGCDIGGAKELGVIYFPTNWGAKEPQNPPNHRVVNVWHAPIPLHCLVYISVSLMDLF